MLIHRGQKLKEKIHERGMPLSEFCKRLEISRSTIYNWFEREDLPLEYLIKSSKVLDYDFLKDLDTPLQEMSKVMEPGSTYENWKDKYYGLLEQNWELQKKFNLLMEAKLKEYALSLI